MLTERLPIPCPPQRPAFCPPVSDRAAWRSLPAAARWQAAGEEALQNPNAVPVLPLSLWLDFTRTGNRPRFEGPYFVRRRTVCALAMAEAVTGEGRYLPALADACWTICEESCWQVPAHNLYIRDTTPLPLPDLNRPVIDLFAAETGALLATVYGLFREQLDAYAPGLAARLRGAVETRILLPYLQDHFWWMGGDGAQCNNWTPWCTQNVLLAAAQLAPVTDFPAYVRQAAESLDCFLAEYGDDGCCTEGAQYYGHAAMALYSALEVLCAMMPGMFDDVWAEPKIKNMAEYIVHMQVAGPYYLNFSDCSAKPGARRVREYLFGKRVGSTPLMALAARDWAGTLQAPDPDGMHHPDISEGINLYYHIVTAFAETEITACARTAQPCTVPDVWYPSVGILAARCGAYLLGAKAGCNADSHNHNDVGSIILYKDGLPVFIDVGVETYSQKTFSPQRYEIWTMQSAWHNLPVFDPDGAAYQQQPGAEYAAADVTLADDLHSITMDIAPAYGSVPGLGYYRRTVNLTETGLTLRDETDYPGTIALTLMTMEKPQAQGNALHLGSTAVIRFSALPRLVTEAVPITDPRLRLAWPDTLYRTRLYFTSRIDLTVQ